MSNNRLPVAALVLSASALIGIAVHEGWRETPYLDAVGVKTVGFGSTANVQGRISVEHGLVRLGSDVARHEEALGACLGDTKLFQHEWDAYVSLAYNVGAFAVCDSSIKPKLQAGQYEAACKTILDFDKVRDRSKPKVLNPRTGKMEYPLVPLRGLTIRRQAEYRQRIGKTP
jgi:lysozyme